jgi:hypothetical protein
MSKELHATYDGHYTTECPVAEVKGTMIGSNCCCTCEYRVKTENSITVDESGIEIVICDHPYYNRDILKEIYNPPVKYKFEISDGSIYITTPFGYLLSDNHNCDEMGCSSIEHTIMISDLLVDETTDDLKMYLQLYQNSISENLFSMMQKVKDVIRCTAIPEAKICPSCKSTNTLLKEKKEDNEICGPGYRSWVVDSYYSCRDCGTRFDEVLK